MKILIAALAAVATVTAVAAPAVAQPYREYDRHDGRYEGRHDGRGGYHINDRQAELRRAIEVGERRGRLTSYEASRLRQELSDIRVAESHHRANGLSPRERAHLDRRLDRISWRLDRELNDRDYGYGYGYRR